MTSALVPDLPFLILTCLASGRIKCHEQSGSDMQNSHTYDIWEAIGTKETWSDMYFYFVVCVWHVHVNVYEYRLTHCGTHVDFRGPPWVAAFASHIVWGRVSFLLLTIAHNRLDGPRASEEWFSLPSLPHITPGSQAHATVPALQGFWEPKLRFSYVHSKCFYPLSSHPNARLTFFF